MHALQKSLENKPMTKAKRKNLIDALINVVKNTPTPPLTFAAPQSARGHAEPIAAPVSEAKTAHTAHTATTVRPRAKTF